jgi:anaerobic magnesium-protoporphyrin IX monomethyl ester cyclase
VNVLLISPAMKSYRRTSELPMALISIATFLTQKGHRVKVIDRLVKVTNIEKIVEAFKPDFVGLTLMYVKTIDDARKCAQVSRKYGAKIVYGGHLASDTPELVLNENYVDFVIMGEGEHAWQELLLAYQNGEEYSGIKGLAYKKDDRIVLNECRNFCDLADLPPMDFSFVNPPDYFQTYNYCKKQVHLYTSKGCPGRCAFCFNAHFHQSTHRKRPVEHVVEEIRCLVNEYGADGIYFEDEILRTNSKDIVEICEAFKASGINFVWGCKMRFGILKPEDYALMYESGCRWIFSGVETASKDMCSIIHKGIKLDDARTDISNCAKAGILPVTSFIVGLPDETSENLKETVQFAKSIEESVIFCGYFVLFYGSEFYEKFLAEGKITPAKKLDDLNEYPIIDDYFKVNYSKTPTRDLKVIRAYLLWWSFKTSPPSKDDSEYSLMKKAFTESFKTVSRMGLIGFFAEVYSAFFVAVSFGFNLFCFPRIKKKYGLTLNRTQ